MVAFVVPKTTSAIPPIDMAIPMTPRRLTRSTPSIRPTMAMNAGEAAMTSAGVARSRARDSFDEENLIHAVPEHAEREQDRDLAGDGSGPRLASAIARSSTRGEQNANAVVGERVDERRPELHDREVHAPDDRHEHERCIREPDAPPGRAVSARPGKIDSVAASPALEPMR